MAYCRWSCDDGQCDVYCYQSVDGAYLVYVASARHVLAEALPPLVPFDVAHVTEWMAREKAVGAIIARSKIRPIGGPYDGAGWAFDTPAETANQLAVLRAAGYLVPQRAIDLLRAEAAEMGA